MENIKLIRKIAYSFHATTGLEYEELLGEATVAYYEARKMHEPEKGALSTWTWTYMHNRLLYYLQTQARWERNNYKNPKTDSHWEDSHFLLEFMDELPEDSKLVCEMILDSPREFFGNTQKETMGQVEARLRELGWAWKNIRGCLKEIKKALMKTA